MWLMLNNDKADDFVISTGVYHSVKDFIDISAKCLGMNTEWVGEGIDSKLIEKDTNKTIVKVDKNFFRPAEVEQLLGDSSKANNALGWNPKVKFDNLVEMMVEFDFNNS